MERHRKQEWEFLRTQLDDQRDLLRKHMEILQRQQMTQLDVRHEKEMKEMNSQQAKQAVETAKEVSIRYKVKNQLIMCFVFGRLPMIKL